MWNIEAISDSFTIHAPIVSEKIVRNDGVGILIRRIIEDFEANGIHINKASRLHKYASLFKANSGNDRDDSYHARLDLAFLESLQFEAVRRSLAGATECSPQIQKAILESTGGHWQSTMDRPDCKARSTQFELFLWSCFRVAGFRVQIAEPDLLLSVSGERDLAVAAKRPRSERKIIKNLRSACRQIAESRRDGFVALDLSFVESIRKPVYVRRPESILMFAKVILDGFIQDRAQELCEAVSEQNVIGILFHFSGIVRAMNDPMRLVSRRWVFLQPRGQQQHEDIALLMKRLQSLGQST